MAPLWGWWDLHIPEDRAKHIQKHRLLPSEVEEAWGAAQAVEGGPDWEWSDEHGWSAVAVGYTYRKKLLAVHVVPDSEDWDRWDDGDLFDEEFEDWEGPWRLVTAYRTTQ